MNQIYVRNCFNKPMLNWGIPRTVTNCERKKKRKKDKLVEIKGVI